MPRSIQEILDHGDELARRFEDYEPSAGDERPVEEHLLERATIARARGERQVVEAINHCEEQRNVVAEEPRLATSLARPPKPLSSGMAP